MCEIFSKLDQEFSRFEDIRKKTETSWMNTWTEKQAANGWRIT